MKGVSWLTLFVALALIGGVTGLLLLRLADELERPRIVIVDPLPGAVIAVSIEGAVATPGVYELPATARLTHLIDEAGGVTENADLAHLNLAERLSDEARIIVPTLAPEVPAAAVAEAGATPGAAFGIAIGDARLNINIASEAELDGLPGIGPVLASLILEERERSGGFDSVDDLVSIPGISQRMVDEIRPLITT